MANFASVQASQLALVIILMMLIMVIEIASPPQVFGSVGWHGGKKKR